MAEPGQPINAGEGVANAPPSNMAVDGQAQFRTLSRRLDELTEQLKGVERPNKFRLADAVTLAGIVLTIAVAIFTAFGLTNRIDDLVKGQAAAEARLTTQIIASEARVSARVDRIDDRVGKLGERAAALEGAATPR